MQVKFIKSIIPIVLTISIDFIDNPFILCSIKTNTCSTRALVFDLAGQIIKLLEITKKGTEQLNVFASAISSGICTYSLIADGVAIETKNMAKR